MLIRYLALSLRALMRIDITNPLFSTLDRRVRPEDVARIIQDSLVLTPSERKTLAKASSGAGKFSSMTSDFARPTTMARQMAVARSLFASVVNLDPADMNAVEEYLRQAESEIGKALGASDFRRDRLTREQRLARGLDISKRQYNKRFRLASRMEAKRARVLREQLKRSLHVLPDAEVLGRIDAEKKGQLLGECFTLLKQAADLLGEVWIASNINRETMVVRRGNDSTTWNVTAGAWNKLRSGWFSLLFSLGLQDWIEAMCPGKVLRLMAADVAAWHRVSGGDLHSDTGPWCDLPLPWEVLNGEPCPRARVVAVCEKWKVDPVKAGWIAPPPERRVAAFTPTPELVHGVQVASPQLAALLRKAGVFSGKSLAWPAESI